MQTEGERASFKRQPQDDTGRRIGDQNSGHFTQKFDKRRVVAVI